MTQLSRLIKTIVLAVTLGFVFGLALGLILLAFSSMGTRSIFVMVWWTIVVMGSEAFGNAAKGFNSTSLQAVNFLGNYHNAGAWLFSTNDRLGVSGWISSFIVLMTTALAIYILHKRIRPVEVVS